MEETVIKKNVDGVLEETNRTLTNQEEIDRQIDNDTSEEASFRYKLPIEIKKITQGKIIALVPEWNTSNFITKQMNMMMGGLIIVNQRGQRPLTPQEETTVSDLEALSTQIEAIRSASDVIEADIINMSFNDLKTYDPLIDPRWPK